MRSSIRSTFLYAAGLVGVLALLSTLPARADARAPRVAAPAIGSPAGQSKASATGFANPAQAAQALAGSGVTISNAAWKGEIGIGSFSGASSLVGLDTGVVMTTGYLGTIFRASQSGETSDIHDFAFASGDAQLDALVAPYGTFDATILEFDVTTSASSITIRYVFASEEYNEFVGSEYNDVFAFFVNGVNCAKIGNQPVAVNSINGGANASQYIDNTGGARAIEFDGLTVVLTCTAAVTPNVPNHVKLAIADVSDPIYDAAVFLSAGGITAGGGNPQPGEDVLAVEFFHAGMGHYFITAIPAEINALDSGAVSGWARTGQTFKVWTSGTGMAEVCRFFTTFFAPKSSHFYTALGNECQLLKQNPVWQYEGIVFLVVLPDAGGSCPVGRKLYRLYNNGQTGAPNHRYTVSLVIRQQMIDQGFIPEDGAEWCVHD